MKGADIFLECLKREGVDILFGLPGGVTLDIYDSLYDCEGLRHILTRHEQGAVHMAEGYAKASGKVGVALVTSGPGATNAVTGIADAYMDSVPLVCFTGQVNTYMIGNDAFQEADTLGITRSCTKHNYLIKNVKDFPRIVREAFYIARTGRPGPVVVDIPKDVSRADAEFVWPETVGLRGYKPTIEGHIGQVRQALKAILGSSRPLLYVGGGAISADASDAVIRFAEKLNIPVTVTLMGLGAYPASGPCYVGPLGMHGYYNCNMAISDCDCLFAIGPRFDDRVTGKTDEFSLKSVKIHIDVDPTSISKNVPTQIPIVGQIGRVIEQMYEELAKTDPKVIEAFKKRIKPWWNQIAQWEKQNPLCFKASTNGKVKPQFAIQKLWEVTKGDAVVATDVGQHQMWAMQYYRVNHPRHFLTSGGLGTMGFGLPAAIGAQFAKPDKLVVCISGDGSLQMNIQELVVAVEHKLPIKVMLINNGAHGMVTQWQRFFYKRRYSASQFMQPDWVKLADAYGARGLRVEKPEDMEAGIREMLKVSGPVLLDVKVDPEEDVFPMVPAGGAVNKMILPESPLS
ncbi:MAG: biosynthetic-type acetolactate synthase large subunit [Nitrospirae bacterium]|nr:biosynthetic-type acetolactate synthase large subunit [Nitrospirota bacterium]